MVNCTYNVTRLWVDYPEPYEDIEGLGVLVGFLGTAWLMVAILIAHYLVFFNPELDPFSNAACQSSGGPETSLKPNPIDSMLLSFLRRCGRRLLRRLGCLGKGRRSFGLSRLQRSMTRCILSFVDLQLIAGLGLLISGFLSLNHDLSAYHWLLVVYLVWLSNITHLSGLTALRSYFNSHRWERGWRLVLMFLFMVLLLVALGPTAFFNRETFDLHEGTYFFTICEPSSHAICFFDPVESLKAYREVKEDLDRPLYTHTPFSRSIAFQSMLMSMVLVVLNFFGKVFRVFPFVSRFLTKSLRRRASDLAKRALLKLSPTTGHPFPRILNERQWLFLVTKPCLAVFLVVRFYVDIFVSAQFEIYLLFISGLWATLNICLLKAHASYHRGDETSTTWSFGQTLPVVMLLGPAITALGAFFGESEPANNLSAGDTDPLGILARQNHQYSNQIGDPTYIRNEAASSSFLLQPRTGASPAQVPTQVEAHLQSREPLWLQRNYYQTNWAPAVCLWSCLLFSTIGLIVITLGSMGSNPPLTLIRQMWVWVLVAQPATTFALILIHLAGEELQGARKWLSYPAVCHGMALVLSCLSAGSFVALLYVPFIGFDLRYTLVGLPVFVGVCAWSVLWIMFYVVLMFFMAK